MNAWLRHARDFLLGGAACAWMLCGGAHAAEKSDAEAVFRVPVQSSSITSVGYGRASRRLEIEFRSGAVYRYREVPEAVFTAFSAARSKGRFFSTEIRGKYPFDKMRGPKK